MDANNDKPKQSIRPMAFGFYFWPVVFISFAGLADSLYLAVSHYRVYTDIAYESFCAISRAINCDTVSQSRYAIMGPLPVPVWGVIGYILVLILLVFVRWAKTGGQRMWALLLTVALIFSGFSTVLAVISHIYIKSYCIMCIASYGINFLLLFYSWLIRRRFDSAGFLGALKRDILFLSTKWRLTAVLALPFTVSVISLWLYFPSYWEYQAPEIPAILETGQTAEGFPWIGAENRGNNHYRICGLHVFSVQQAPQLPA